MASFIAKQMVGNQLKSVKGAIGGDKDKDEEKKEGGEEAVEGAEEGEDPEITAARLEAEEKRAEKHRKMEEERETMRQGIRDKYGIKKKEPEHIEDPMQMDAGGSLTRKKKTPAEMAAEREAEDEDDDANMFPKSMDEFKAKVTELPGNVMTSVSEATQKCVLQ